MSFDTQGCDLVSSLLVHALFKLTTLDALRISIKARLANLDFHRLAMKREVVKRLRQRRETSVLQRRSRGRLYAFGVLSDTTTLADSTPQALGEVFFAKGAVVRWRRERSGHTWNGAISRGQFHRLLRSVRCHCASEGAGLAGFIASAVTERSTVEF